MQTGDSDENQKTTIDPELRKGFKLNEVIVLPNDGEIIRQGKRHHLPPTAMQILLFLCGKKGQTVTTSELLDIGWGDPKANRKNLTHVITEIRHVLDDHKECPEFIQTFSRKGYRLIANLAPLDKDNPILETAIPEEHSNNWHLSIALLKNSKLLSVSFAFMVGTWVLLQVMDFLFPIFNIPNWWLKIVVLVLVVGFPLVLLFTWLKEIKVKKFLYAKEKDKIRKRFFFKQLAVDFSFIGLLSVGVGFLSFYLIESIETDQKTGFQSNSSTSLNIPIDDKLIGVLPFQFRTGKTLPEYFEATFQGELINALSRQETFKLVSQRAINEIPVTSRLSDFAKKLGTRYLIDGEITGDKTNFSIKLTLLDTQQSRQVWTSTIQGKPDNLLSSQKELYRQIFNALSLLEKNPFSDNRTIISTNDFKAYDSYIQGKNQLDKTIGIDDARKAEGYFLNALNFDPGFTLATAGLCQAHLDQYQLTQETSIFRLAQNSCNSLLKVKQLKSDALVALGNLNHIRGEYEKAISFYDNALELESRNLMAIIGTANSQTELGNYVLAESLFQQAISIEPGYWKNYLSLGDFYFNKGEYYAASEQFSRVTLLKPNYDQAYNRLGASYYLDDKLERASAAWKQSLQIKPSALNYSNLGSAQFFSKDFTKAVLNYTRAIDLKPADAVLWGNLGDAEQFSRHFDKAHQAYQNAYDLAQKQLQINPNDQYIQGMLARYQSELGNCEPALLSVEALRKKNITDPYLFYDLSLISLNCNQTDQARELISMAVSQGYPQSLLSRDIQFKDLFIQLPKP